MTIRVLLPLITATVICGGSALVEASKPQPPVVQPQWAVFNAPDGRFTVLMPGQPDRNTQIQKTYMGEINLEMFVAEPPNQEVAYLVVYNDFPYSYAQMTAPQTILDDARDMALKTTNSNLVRQRNIVSSNGHPGKEIEYVNASGKITRNRMYVAEGRLYQVMAIASKKQQPTLARTITGYLNSFHLVLQK
ncbi:MULTISPECIES: hypothetical protein [unclassified Nodularia (in: cyanobacteria)]|uniref:hypothetical protein n=1 Tax=unclassified Nodularia (in: cyanobacteria) TaxID=2656917 RepID=UPI00188112D7|nr:MULTISPECIES: hypothetical protein [unclassified Nodularia (in: cyanobacteria)]MBE9199227.1 hypothetical protein [Nodularia sp. LEGE 06071]MCC2693306.1 hypothetical protein [Nodularia sp. LEGE 04288]